MEKQLENRVFGGATVLYPQLEAPFLLTAAPVARLARIPNIAQVLAPGRFSPVGNDVSRGDAVNPQG